MTSSSQTPSPPFVVKGRRRNGTVTYLCPTPEWALRKLADFDRMGYAEIAATGPDGTPIDEKGLTGLLAPPEATEPAVTWPGLPCPEPG